MLPSYLDIHRGRCLTVLKFNIISNPLIIIIIIIIITITITTLVTVIVIIIIIIITVGCLITVVKYKWWRFYYKKTQFVAEAVLSPCSVRLATQCAVVFHTFGDAIKYYQMFENLIWI